MAETPEAPGSLERAPGHHSLVIRCRENGPLVIQGPVRIVDHLGQEFTLPTDKPQIALCRCGTSGKKPFCDGSHKRIGFQACEKAQPDEE